MGGKLTRVRGEWRGSYWSATGCVDRTIPLAFDLIEEEEGQGGVIVLAESSAVYSFMPAGGAQHTPHRRGCGAPCGRAAAQGAIPTGASQFVFSGKGTEVVFRRCECRRPLHTHALAVLLHSSTSPAAGGWLPDRQLGAAPSLRLTRRQTTHPNSLLHPLHLLLCRAGVHHSRVHCRRSLLRKTTAARMSLSAPVQ